MANEINIHANNKSIDIILRLEKEAKSILYGTRIYSLSDFLRKS